MMNRVKRMRSRRGLPALRYIYITERTESAAYGVRWHHHVIMSGDGLTREEIEEKWTKRHGGFCNTRRAQPTERQEDQCSQGGARGRDGGGLRAGEGNL